MTNQIDHQTTVPPHLTGHRADQIAAALFPDHSRARLAGWIKTAALKVDGHPIRPRDRLQAGQTLHLHPPPKKPEQAQPQPLPLTILFEDPHLLILDKPPGLVVHPAAGNPDGTLLNALLHHHPNAADLPRAGLVHRLDKDTSGLLAVAKTPQAQTALVRQLQARTITREYLAVACGHFTGPGTIDAPIGRHPKHRRKMAVTPGGKPAITHYRPLEQFAAHSLLKVRLETGRTHQIRVHLAHRGTPLLGDPLYAPRPRKPTATTAATELTTTLRNFSRQALHATHLALKHPKTTQPMHWQSPPPQDIHQLLTTLRSKPP